MDEKSRIEKIMQAEALTPGQFAQEIGIQNSTLSHILNNRNKPSLDVMKKILNRFSNIQADWLILGVGTMYRQEIHSQMPSLFDDDEETIIKSDEYPSIQAVKKVPDLSDKERIISASTVDNESRPALKTNIDKSVTKIILYYSDNTYQEFFSK